MIFLHKPYIKTVNNKSRLIFNLDIDEEKKQVFYEVDKEYSKYLCDDRVDAILVGILHYALQNGHDIKSDSYITDELLYNLKESFIPVMIKHGKTFKEIKIDIKTKKSVKTADAAGTGCSCGVDSLYAIIRHLNYDIEGFNIDYLCINNVGSFNECYSEAGIEKVRNERIKKSKELAKEINIPLIVTDSNFYQEIPQNHLITVTYSSCFAILCLQKLWGKYYYGSVGLDYSKLSIIDCDKTAASHYDLLALDCFSNRSLKIFSDGGGLNRLDKLKFIYDNKLYKKYVHVCTTREYNCGLCPKCRRELLSLYALNVNLDEYREVFDIDYFQDNITEYFDWIYNEHLYSIYHPGNYSNEVTYQELLKNETFKSYVSKKADFDKVNDISYYVDEVNRLNKDVEWLNKELNNITSSKGYKILNKIYSNSIYKNIKKIREKNKVKKKQLNDRYEMYKPYEEKFKMSAKAIYKDVEKCKKLYQATFENYRDFQFYKLSKAERSTYLTDGYMWDFVKKYNDQNKIEIFRNKYQFDKKFKKFLKRDFIATKDLTFNNFNKFLKNKKKFVYKPLDLALGQGFRIYDVEDNDIKILYKDIINLDNGILEDYIYQHDDMKSIAESVNTIRILTFNNFNKCNILAAILRMGVNSYVDNFSAGGIVASIDIKTGKVCTKGVDKYQNEYYEHPVSKIKIDDIKIPYWDRVLKLVEECYDVIPEVRYIGWDIAITNDGPVIIEGNATLPDYSMIQVTNLESKKGMKNELEKIINDD